MLLLAFDGSALQAAKAASCRAFTRPDFALSTPVPPDLGHAPPGVLVFPDETYKPDSGDRVCITVFG
jgi:hypothetical protein